MLARAFVAPLVSVLAAAAAHAQQVHVVDAALAPGASFTTIQAAIDAAGEGDVILVRTGVYPSFTVDHKSLTIAGDGAPPLALQNCHVVNIASGQQVVVRNLRFVTLDVAACIGPVWLEELRDSLAGLEIETSNDVVLAHCDLTPLVHDDPLVIFDATVSLYDCALGASTSAGVCINLYGSNGLPALTVSSSVLALRGCTLEGGDGGPGCSGPDPSGQAPGTFCGAGGNGGPALYMWGQTTATTLDTQLRGGDGGAGGAYSTAQGSGTCPDGVSGAGVTASATDTLTSLPGKARSLSVSSPTREGAAVSLTCRGVAGDHVLVVLGASLAPTYIPLALAKLLPSPPLVFALGTLPASGALVLSVPIHELGAGVEAVTLFAQLAALATDGGVHLGSGSAVLLLDQAF